MDPKTALTTGVFCPMPWTGLMYNSDGTVKNCIRSSGAIGNIKENTIEEILSGPINLDNQSMMLNDIPVHNCAPCYDLEQGKRGFDIISDRIFYMRELKKVPFDTYTLGNHELHTVDVRWSNLCNFACVYCNSSFSSKWASELGVRQQQPTQEQLSKFTAYIMQHAPRLTHVYMAGGEPLLMKENLQLLDVLWKHNPNVNLRINTNLSRVDTRVFETVCKFKNVHWTVSVEAQGLEFEYIRWGSNWQDFRDNLGILSTLDHKISFNMLHFLLNSSSIFNCVDYLRSIGFHANSFIIGPLTGPLYLNIRHLPQTVLESVKSMLESRINDRSGYLLEDSYRNLLHHIQQPFEKDLAASIQKLQIMDQRRGLDSRQIFPDLYALI